MTHKLSNLLNQHQIHKEKVREMNIWLQKVTCTGSTLTTSVFLLQKLQQT